MAPNKLNRSDLKIVYFPIDPTEDVDQGCVIVHRPTGHGAVGEDGTKSSRENLLAALSTLAPKLGVNAEEAQSLFQCRQCGRDHLPKVEGWTDEHVYRYVKKAEVNEEVVFCTVSRECNDPVWIWALERTNGEQITYDEVDFIEDAFEAANVAALKYAEEKKKED